MTNVIDVLPSDFVEIDIKKFSSSCAKGIRSAFGIRLTPKQVELTVKMLNLRSAVYYKDLAYLMRVPVRVVQYIVKQFEDWLKLEYGHNINKDSSVFDIACSCDQLLFWRNSNE